MANVLQPGQVVEVGGKKATVITVGDGIVHLEQDGEAISVNPGDVMVPGGEAPADGEEKPAEIPAVVDAAAPATADQITAEIVALKQRMAALEAQAERTNKNLAALIAGPTKSQTESASTAAVEGTAATAPADDAIEAGNAALPASD